MFNRSRRHLAYLFTLSMGSILILFAFTIFYRQVKDQLQVFDRLLSSHGKIIAGQTNYQFKQGQWQIEPENVSLKTDTTLPVNLDIIYIRWYDSQQKLVQFIGAANPRQRAVKPGWQTLEYYCDHDKSDTMLSPCGTRVYYPPVGQCRQQYLRQFTLPVTLDKTLVAYVQIAAPLELIQESIGRSRLFLSLGVPVALGLTGLAGWILGGLAMQPIKRSYEQLQRFTADASHELRAPVAAILSNSQVGLLAPEHDLQQPRQRLANIVTHSKSMSALISNLLFLARHEGKLNPKDLVITNIAEILESIAEKYQMLAAEKEIKFKSYLPQTPITLNVDPELLQQAIINLLNNALKYTPSGGTVTLRLFEQSRRVSIQVEDTGIGIPAADLPYIFDRFYRVDEARARKTGGFGLGLALADQIIQAHDGKITVDSNEGEGTTFQICLPL